MGGNETGILGRNLPRLATFDNRPTALPIPDSVVSFAAGYADSRIQAVGTCAALATSRRTLYVWGHDAPYPQAMKMEKTVTTFSCSSSKVWIQYEDRTFAVVDFEDVRASRVVPQTLQNALDLMDGEERPRWETVTLLDRRPDLFLIRDERDYVYLEHTRDAWEAFSGPSLAPVHSFALVGNTLTCCTVPRNSTRFLKIEAQACASCAQVGAELISWHAGACNFFCTPECHQSYYLHGE